MWPQGGGGGGGGGHSIGPGTFFVSESSNKNCRHIRSNWPTAACLGEVE